MNNGRKGFITIRQKLMLSYLLLVLIIVLLGVLETSYLNTVYTNGNNIYETNLKTVDYLKGISQNLRETDRDILYLASGFQYESYEEDIDEINELRKDSEYLLRVCSSIEKTDMESRRFNQCRLSILSYNKKVDEIIEMMKAGHIKIAADTYTQELNPIKDITFELIDAMVELAVNNAETINEQNSRIYRRMVVISSLTGAFAIIIAFLTAILMSTYFSKRLESIKKLANRLSEYDISDDIIGAPKDEFGQTMEALNDSQFMIRELMNKIIEESDSISEAGEEMSLAMRRGVDRIETVNVEIIQGSEILDDIKDRLNEIVKLGGFDEADVAKFKKITESSDKLSDILKETRHQLSSIAMYLEQIGITSDYQNELTRKHKEQVQKFKV